MSKDQDWFCVNAKDFKDYKIANPYDGGKTEISVFKVCADSEHIRILKGAEGKGEVRQDGKSRAAGAGSRTPQVGPGTKRRILSDNEEESHTGTTASPRLAGRGGSVFPVPAELKVIGRCVAEVLELITGVLFESTAPWVPMKMVPNLVSLQAPTLKCVKPSKWFPCDTHKILDCAGNFCEDSIAALCKLATINFKAIVQVVLGPGNNSMHCVAIFDRLIVDPEDGVRRPLTVKSFEDLKIVKIVTGFMIVKHGRTHLKPKPKRTKPS